MTVIGVGQRMARGTGSCGRSRPKPILRADSTGLWWAWNPPCAALTSMLPAPASRRRKNPGKRTRPVQHRADEALGRSRGGLSTKVHLAGEGGLRPLALLITPGQWGDAPQMIPVLEQIHVQRPAGGRPRTRPDHLSGDKAYSSRHNRRYLRRRQIRHTIPEPENQRANRRRRGSAGGRPVGFPATVRTQERSRAAHRQVEDQPCCGDALRHEGLRLSRHGHRRRNPAVAPPVRPDWCCMSSGTPWLTECPRRQGKGPERGDTSRSPWGRWLEEVLGGARRPVEGRVGPAGAVWVRGRWPG